MNILGSVLYKKFQSLFRLLPSHAVSYVIKCNNFSECTQSELAQKIVDVVKSDEFRDFNREELLKYEPSKLVEKGLEQLVKMKALTVSNGSIKVRKKEIVAYYAAAFDKMES